MYVLGNKKKMEKNNTFSNLSSLKKTFNGVYYFKVRFKDLLLLFTNYQ